MKTNQSGNKKILAVDDEATNLKLLEAILVQKVYIVETVLSGEEALDRIKSINPDIILLDVMMPKLNATMAS